MKLVLARHGEALWNASGRFQGRGDIPLSDLGRRQARALARACRRFHPAALYTSPLARARETAALVEQALGLPAQPLEDLQEAHLGELEGLTAEEFRLHYPDLAEAWRQDPAAVAIPGGESLVEVQARAWQAVVHLAARHPHDTIVAVSHNFVIRSLVCRVLGLPLQRLRTLDTGLASITVLHVDGERDRLLALNDRCHLEGLEAPGAYGRSG